MLIGRPSHPGEYDYPGSSDFKTIDDARNWCEAKLSLTWDTNPDLPPSVNAALNPADEAKHPEEEQKKLVG